jgi:opacity protein-like surface antigen
MNKKMAAAGLLLDFLGSITFAVGFIGTPTPELGQGNWGVGFNYSYSSQDLDKKSYTWDDGDVDKLKLKNFNTGRYYGSVGYGINDCWDIYAQLGFADVKTDGNQSWDGGGFDWGMNFDNDFAWGWGTKFCLANQGNVDWGAVFQMNWLDTSFDGTVDGAEDEADIETYDILVAVGPTIDMGGWKLYGGPYFYYLNGDYDEVWDGDKVKSDLRNDDFGGYLGASFDLCPKSSLKIEYANNFNDNWSLGTGILFKF